MRRSLNLDMLRFIATIAVIVLHISAQNYNNVDIPGKAFSAFVFTNGLVRWCVPIFVMISGSLFLGKELSIGILYKKYIWRLFFALVSWSGIYAMWDIVNGSSISEAIGQFITGHYHLWYLYMAIGIYSLIPVLNKIVSDKVLEKYFMLITFLFGILVPTMNNIFSLKFDILHSWTDTILVKIDMPFASCFVFYFVIGGYIQRHDFKKNNRLVLYAASFASLVVSILLTINISKVHNQQYVDFYAYNSLFVMVVALGIMVGINELSKHISSDKIKKIFIRFSKIEFGVYLVHPLIIEFLKQFFGLDTLSFSPAVAILFNSIIVILLSYITAAVLHRIPFLNKICS